MKETSLIQSLLKEDQNFCKTSEPVLLSEISQWSNEENKHLLTNAHRKNKFSVSPQRLPKILEVSEEENYQHVISFSQKLQKYKDYGKVIRGKLNELYFKLKRGLDKEFENENCTLIGSRIPLKKKRVESCLKVNVKAVGHDRSRSLQLYPNEKSEHFPLKSTSEEARSRKDYIKLTLTKQNCRTEDLNLILEGKGEPKHEKSQISRPKRSVSNISSIVLPQIRSKSTISHFSLFNSGVPTISRF